MPALHLFIPGHETAVLLGVPLHSSQKLCIMTHDLACLPFGMQTVEIGYTPDLSEPEFYPKTSVYTELLPSFSVQRFFRTTEVYKANPWGISPSALRILNKNKTMDD
jgi:hypothetical protein